MLGRTTRSAIAVLVATAITTLAVGVAEGSGEPPGTNAGPIYEFETEIIGGTVVPLKDLAILQKTAHGYRFRTGQQTSHLVVTLVDGGLRFHDTGTKSFLKRAAACKRVKVKRGIAAVCRVPDGISERQPLLVEIWPRLGDDYSDTSSLPASFSVTVLSDEGDDEAHFGPGRDFFNGYLGRDRVYGGGGNDWIRGGPGHDTVLAGPGDDDVVGMDGPDTIVGGDGNDRLWSSNGNDRLAGGAGLDLLVCGTGHDIAKSDSSDRILSDCEGVAKH